MGTVLSGLSLLMALALVGLLITLSRADARRMASRGNGGGGRGGTYGSRRLAYYTPMGYAFSTTFLAAVHLIAGLIGYRLNRGHGNRWSESVIWWEVWVGLAAAAVAVYLWRRGLRDIRSNVHIPELAGHDAAAPPSRRIERR
jgi:hypothetical protein